ncbi:hypothetical protein TIFTF001_009555 [Ficus carica]|uniref:Uncharacterized protein n=1 Tax=Ficus carica TaxID=3494 RepID=A0AA88AAL9_FICCA|nr:hypothetical protein TIFTF001_009555 [Ficus carica]
MSHTALVVESMINEVLTEWNEEFDEKEIIPDFYGVQGQGLNDYGYNPPLSEYRWGVGNNIWTLRDQEPAAQALRSATGIDMDQGQGSTQDLKEMIHTALLIQSMINEVLSESDENYYDEKEIISPDFYEVQGQGMNNYSYNPPLSEYRWGVGNNIWTLQDHEPAAQALRSSTMINTPYRRTTHEKRQVDDQQPNVADQKPNCKRGAITLSDMLAVPWMFL